MKITSSATGKLMLTGSYAVVHGRPSIVTSVDQRIYVTVEKNGEDVFNFNAPDIGLTAYSKTIDKLDNQDLPKQVRFVEVLYKKFLEKYPQDHGINVETKSDFSASFGFGSSSAVTVAFAKALFKLYKIKKTNKELFDICYETVIAVQGVGSGFDLASAIWGGTIKYVTPAKLVEPIKIKELPIVVAYTGVKADTPTLIRMVDGILEKDPEKINKTFDAIARSTEDLERALKKNDIKLIGKALNDHQQEIRTLGVSSVELEKLISAALDAGAYGASLSGAGGGDCMLAVVDDNNRKAVMMALEAAGGEIMNVKLNI